MHEHVRTATKAIIVRDGALLVTANCDMHGDYHLLPGGGQVPGEALIEALRRECREEIVVAVDVGELVLVRDHIGANHAFAQTDRTEHQVELVFVCRLPDGREPREGLDQDGRQIGFACLPLHELKCYRVYPAALGDAVPRLIAEPGGGVRYLGDVS